MIRELLQTVGNPDVFFALQEKDGHPFYNPITVPDCTWKLLCSTGHYWNIRMFTDLSFGQTRDFINAVADELGEPL